MIKNLKFSRLVERYPVLAESESSILSAINTLLEATQNNKKIWLFGNGGSAADAEHFSGELTKSFINKRVLSETEKTKLDKVDPALKNFVHGGISAIALSSQSSSLSAFSNDIDFKYAYAQLVWAVGDVGDVAIGITTSGNSENVFRAMQIAKAKGLKSIALTGGSESKCSATCDITIKTPGTVTHEVQELHLPIHLREKGETSNELLKPKLKQSSC